MREDHAEVTLMGTLDEKYLSRGAFGIMQNYVTLTLSGDQLFMDDGAIDLEWIRTQVNRAAMNFPILRQRLAPTPGRVTTPAWVTVPNLDLEHHVRLHPRFPLDAQAFIGVGLPPMDPSRPLWDIHCGRLDSGEVALILRMHHAMGDGYIMVQFIHALMSLPVNVDSSELVGPSASPRPPGGMVTLYRAASAWLKEFPPPAAAWREYWRKPFRRRLRRWARRLVTPLGSVDATVASPSPFPDFATFDMGEARTLAKAMGGSINDLVVAATLLAIGVAHPDLPEASLLVPYSKGRAPGARNHVSAVPVTWTRGDTLQQTVSSVSRTMRGALRGEAAPASGTLGYATYVLVSRRPLHFLSARLTRIIGWPTVDASGRVGCLANGYADQLNIGLRTASQETTAVMMNSIRSSLSAGNAPAVDDRG